MFGEMGKIIESCSWKIGKNMFEKIENVVAQAYEQSVKLLETNRMKTHRDFKKLSSKLAELKESEDFVEEELALLSKIISQFKLDIRFFCKKTSCRKVKTEI